MTEDPEAGRRVAEEALNAYKRERFEDAAKLFQEAQEAYTTAGDQSLAAEMANNLSVTLVQMKEYANALKILEGTFEVFVEQGDLMKAAQALGNKAAAYEGLQDWTKAESLYQQAADRFEQLDDQDSKRFTLQALSRVRLRQGRAMEAVSTMQGALETGSKTSWPARLARKILDLPGRILKP
jgi:tetratricopeptide (TPR) repeat protein